RRNAIDDDLMIIAGDNLFDFDLGQFVSFFRQHGTSISLYDTGDLEIMKQYAVVDIDQATQRILDFEEKPQNPRSTLAATCMYIWRRDHLPLIDRYTGNVDAPGH